MKQLILIAIVLSSFGAVAQQKTDTTQHSPGLHLTGKVWHSTTDSLTAGTDTSKSIALSGTSSYTNKWILDATQFPQLYTVNWAKVKTFADLKLIMQNINIMVSDNATNFKKIKKYLIKQK